MSEFIHVDVFGKTGLPEAEADIFGLPLVRTAAFKDVKAKGRRILAEGAYSVLQLSTFSVLAEVVGDTGTYDVYVNRNVRVDEYDLNEMTYWDCTCEWSNWAFNRVYYHGRMCSHAYAMYLLLRMRRDGEVSSVPLDVTGSVEQGIQEEGDVQVDPVQMVEEVFLDLCVTYFDAAASFVLDGIASEEFSLALTEVSEQLDIPVEVIPDLVAGSLVAASDIVLAQVGESLGIAGEKAQALELQSESINVALADVLAEQAEFSGEMLEVQKVQSLLKRGGRAFRTAGRVFTEDEKLALIHEAGLSRQFLLGEIEF